MDRGNALAQERAYARTPRQIIPDKPDNTVTVDRAELLKAVKRFAIILTKTKDLVPMVDLRWEDDELHLSLNRHPDAATDSLPATTDGSGKFTAAISLFAGLLAALDHEQITFGVQPNDLRAHVTSPSDPQLTAMISGARA